MLEIWFGDICTTDSNDYKVSKICIRLFTLL